MLVQIKMKTYSKIGAFLHLFTTFYMVFTTFLQINN